MSFSGKPILSLVLPRSSKNNSNIIMKYCYIYFMRNLNDTQRFTVKLLCTLIYSIFFQFAISSCTQTERKIVMDTSLCPVGFDQVHAQGELLQRAMKNFDRLETDVNHPANVFPAKHHETSAGWPGDKEGRTILALVLEAQATHWT